MKKVFSLIAVASMLVAFASCTPKATEAETTEPAATEEVAPEAAPATEEAAPAAEEAAAPAAEVK